MLRSIEGTYRGGQIKLAQIPPDVREDTYVIVTFVESSDINLQARGIDQANAIKLSLKCCNVGWATSFCCPPFRGWWAAKTRCPPYKKTLIPPEGFSWRRKDRLNGID